jgi:hypothetical protein
MPEGYAFAGPMVRRVVKQGAGFDLTTELWRPEVAQLVRAVVVVPAVSTHLSYVRGMPLSDSGLARVRRLVIVRLYPGDVVAVRAAQARCGELLCWPLRAVEEHLKRGELAQASAGSYHHGHSDKRE